MLVSSSGRNESLNTCALILHFPLPENQSQRRRALPRIERRHQRQQVPSQSLCVFKEKKKGKKKGLTDCIKRGLVATGTLHVLGVWVEFGCKKMVCMQVVDGAEAYAFIFIKCHV